MNILIFAFSPFIIIVWFWFAGLTGVIYKSRLPPWLDWPLWNICVTNDHGYVPFVVNTSRSFPHAWLITGFITRLTRRVQLVEQELLTLPEHLRSPPAFSGVHVCFVNRCLSFCTFSIWPLFCLFFSDIRILITPFGIFKLFVIRYTTCESINMSETTSVYHQ